LHKKQEYTFRLLILLIVCLMTIGVGLILKNYQEYKEEFIKQQESQQLQLTQAVDRNISSLLQQSRNSLDYIIHLEQFQKAEYQWLSGGKNSDMLRYLTENHLDRNELIAGIAVLQDGNFILDEHGRSTFRFINEDNLSSERICIGVTGKYYLALLCQGQKDAAYASMIDLQLLYEKISSIELAESDQLLLLDRNSGIMLHYCVDSNEVKTTQLDSCPDRKDFQLMLTAQQEQLQGCYPFYYQTQKMSRGYNAHIMILPSSIGENQNFTIGLISNIDTAFAPLEKASLNWLLGGVLILCGICLLLILLLHFRRRDIQIARELDLLQQKNIAMEELHRKTSEMEHHQRLEMIGTLTSGIAHEFNNLLTPIMSYSMLTLEQLSSQQDELYDNVLEIYNSSRKAKEITSQLSQYSRKNVSENKLYLQPRLLLERALHVAMPACPKEVHVETHFCDSNAKLYGNETQLSQLFLNLMINAFHSMAETGGSLTISTVESGGQIHISFKDTGCGIPADILLHIFEPFFTTKEGGKGSGLGLAIAQQIAEDHQGHISVYSEKSKGSTFTVTLPAYY